MEGEFMYYTKRNKNIQITIIQSIWWEWIISNVSADSVGDLIRDLGGDSCGDLGK